MSSTSLVRHTSEMTISESLYHRHRFPSEIISHCVWLYFRFSLSFRDVEELMSSRGVSLTYETVREWCLKFGQTTPQVAWCGRPLAPRRSVFKDQRADPLPLACSRSGRRCA